MSNKAPESVTNPRIVHSEADEDNFSMNGSPQKVSDQPQSFGVVPSPVSRTPDSFLFVDELSGVDLSQDITQDACNDLLPKTPEPNSPPRQHYKNSRSIRNLRRPQPQPHVCVLDKTVDGRDVFINVLSWSKILKPEHPLHPIPLYGGNRVLTSNPKVADQLIYVVTANPEVLEKTRRNGGNTQAQHALMYLMTDFVQEMNPGLKLLKFVHPFRSVLCDFLNNFYF